MKLNLNTGILPIVNVGMYDTNISPCSRFDDLDYEIERSSLNETEKEYIVENSWRYFDSQGYGQCVGEIALKYIKEFFGDISDKVSVAVSDEFGVDSPREYNFRTDELDFSIEMEESEIEKIKSAVKGNEKFFAWAERYKSRDGFISFMPYEREEYITALEGRDRERAVSMYFTYLLEREYGYVREDDWDTIYQERFEDYVFARQVLEAHKHDPEVLAMI